jgi:diguanylate cyclase (GGDEF)-like protein
MNALIDRLIELTSLRDREAMDVCLVKALGELLPMEQVQVARVVGDPGDERWLIGASLDAQGVVGASDPSWVDLRDLPPLAAHLDWQACATAGSEVIGERQVLLPLPASGGVVGVVQANLREVPMAPQLHAMRGLLAIFRNQTVQLDYTESDTLTGLLNRKSFDETFYKASALPLGRDLVSEDRRQTAVQQYWLGVVDIDHFKLVNDQHGHLIGDEVLLLLARLMRHSFRALDKLYRFGGEEFVVLLRCPSEEAALGALQRFRAQVEAYVFPRVSHVTVSVGFTDMRTGDTPPAAVERADLAVYYAKRHGRNQVRSHAQLVREGQLTDTAQTGDVEFF